MSLIRTDYLTSEYHHGKWVLELSGTHFIINDDTKKLIDILSVSKNYKDAALRFSSDFKESDFNEKEFEIFTEKIFSGIPIFNSNEDQTTTSKSFIRFQKELLSSSLAGKLSHPISFLFSKFFFWGSFSILCLLGIIVIIKQPVFPATEFSPLWILIIYTSTIILHELGHIAACRKFTGKNGEIGFGIYFIFPVLYSNISSVWLAGKQERIITNLAGIYMQLWCMLLFYLIYFFTHNALSLFISYLITLYCIIQIFPFIRSDGYWLLSDITSTSNLLEKSKTEINSFIRDPKLWIKKKQEKKIFLICYSIFNYAILLYFITTQLLFNYKKILLFPVYIINNVKLLLTLKFDQITFDSDLIIIIVFYSIVFNNVNNFIKKKLLKA